MKMQASARNRRAIVEGLEHRTLLTGSPLVPTFGMGGIASIAYKATADGVNVATLPNGDSYVVGDTAASSGHKLAFVSRFLPSGKIDSTFGTGGTTYLPLSTAGDAIATAVKLQTIGSSTDVVVAGLTGMSSSSYSAFVSRVLPSGKMDTSFNKTGVETFNFGATDAAATAIWIAPMTNKIDVLGSAASFTAAFPPSFTGGVGIAQFNSNGSPDANFGSKGMVLTTPPNSDQADVGTAFVPNPKGGFFVADALVSAGFNFATFSPQITGVKFGVLAFNANGSTNTNFGTKGRMMVSFGNGFEFATGIGVDNKGNLVVGGTSANGTMDFGTPLPSNVTNYAPAATVANFVACRMSMAGKLDLTFHKTGTVSVNFGAGVLAGCSSMIVTPTGDILLAGGSEKNHGNAAITLAELNTSGALDTAFASAGTFIDAISGLSTGIFNMTVESSSTTLKHLIINFVGHLKKSGASGNLMLGQLIAPW